MESTIKLGDRVRDTMTGFEGIAVAFCHYIYGCTQIYIQPETLDKDQKPIEAHWFDEQRVELVEAKLAVVGEAGDHPGGPQDTPPGPNRPPQ